MSEKSKIEWTDATWNPLRGCSKVSEGCRNCYAIKTARRFHKEGEAFDGLTEQTAAGLNWTGKVMLVPDKLNEPLHWREPKRIFVNSMSDLFHPEVPFDFVDQVFAVMALASQHTFQILTKRPERMLQYINGLGDRQDAAARLGESAFKLFDAEADCFIHNRIHGHLPNASPGWPLPNVWLGTSVENQKAADERIPFLLQTPAAVRFLSCEPLLGPVDLTDGYGAFRVGSQGVADQGVDWVIAGGESGPGARPAHPDWFRSLRDQCQAAGVAFHFKQWGEWAPGDNFPDYIPSGKSYGFVNETVWRVGKKAAGRLLDGRTWDEFPEVRQ